MSKLLELSKNDIIDGMNKELRRSEEFQSARFKEHIYRVTRRNPKNKKRLYLK